MVDIKDPLDCIYLMAKVGAADPITNSLAEIIRPCGFVCSF